MTRLRWPHWGLALMLALATHMAAYLFSIAQPGSEPAYRGGGLFERGGGLSSGDAGIVVQLGAAAENPVEAPGIGAPQEQPPAQTTREIAPLTHADEPVEPASAVREIEPPKPPEPAVSHVPEPAVRTPAKEPVPKIAAVPAPARKPKGPGPMPETPGPLPSARAEQAPAAPVREGAKTAAGQSKGDKKTTTGLTFGAPAGRLGNASGNSTGEVRELTYGDRVMLWLQQHGEYPLQAERYGLKDTVTVEFAINRQGRILYYKLIGRSQWYLLNTAVREMMDSASPVPPMPPEIAMDEMTFTVPVRFSPP